MNQPAGIVFVLSQQLGDIIGKHLAQADFDDEKLWLEILLTLNKKIYRNKLLFKDFSIEPQDEWEWQFLGKQWHRVNREANFYLCEVLGKRLTLANNLFDKPTNMHALLVAYCRSNTDIRWQDSRIVRDNKAEVRNSDFFCRVASKLKQQCAHLGNRYSDISKRRRLEFGAFWLKADGCAAEVVEELSLFEVVEAAPTLLENAAQEPALLLLRVLESLNEKYGLLRSCGLPPEEWFNNAELSIARLKQLKQLRKLANELITQGASKELAYRNAFIGLANGGGNVMGFTEFSDFLASPISRRIFFPKILASKTDIDGNEIDEDEGDLQDIAGNTSHDEAEPLDWLAEYDSEFDAVTAYAFQHLILESRELSGKQGLINDPEFLRVVQQHREYKNLSRVQLLATLQRRLETIIKAHREDR